MIPESLLRGFTEEEFHFYIRNRLLAIWEPLMDNKTVEDAFQALIWGYTPWPYVDDMYNNRGNTNLVRIWYTVGSRYYHLSRVRPKGVLDMRWS